MHNANSVIIIIIIIHIIAIQIVIAVKTIIMSCLSRLTTWNPHQNNSVDQRKNRDAELDL